MVDISSVDNIKPTKEQRKKLKQDTEAQFKLMMDEYKAASYSEDRKRPTRDDAREYVLSQMPIATRQLFTGEHLDPAEPDAIDNMMASVGEVWGDFSETVSGVTSTYVGQPTAPARTAIREQAQQLPERSEGVVGSSILNVAKFATPMLNSVSPELGKMVTPALDVVTGKAKNPIAGIADESSISKRFEMLGDAVESFGIDLDAIEASGVNVGAVEGLLGTQTDIEDARDLVSIVDGALKEYGLENILGTVDTVLGANLGFTTVEKEIQKMPDELSVPVLAAKGIVDAVSDLRELIEEYDSKDTTDDRKKAIGLEISRLKFELGADINKLADTVEGIPAALEMVPGKRLQNLVRGQISERIGDKGLQMLQEPIVGSGLRAVGAALTDDEHQLQRALSDLGESNIQEYLPEPGPDATPEDHELHRKQKEFLSTTIEGIVALMTSKDASEIETKMEQVVEVAAKETAKGGLFENEYVDVSEEAPQIAEGMGKIVSGQQQDEQSQEALSKAIGGEVIDQITGNPMIMAAIFGTTALGLGGIGAGLGKMSGGKGMGAMLGGSLPMLTPIILRGVMGDQYTEGMKGINQMMAPFTDKLFNLLPDKAYETPLLGNLLGAARDNPLGTSLFTFGQLSGNDAFQDAGTGMMLANLLYGDSTARDDQAQAAASGPAGMTGGGTSASAVQVQTSQAVPGAGNVSPQENVGATTRSTDASAAYAIGLSDPRNHSRFVH